MKSSRSCFSLDLSYPTIRIVDMETLQPRKMSFNKCYFIIMDQKYFQNYENIIEIVSEMFQEFPIFTIILSLNQPTDSEQFLNKGNSPLVFISAQQV